MPGPICIITPTGMICEALSSYERYDPLLGKRPFKKLAVKKKSWKQMAMKERVGVLMEVAKVKDAPFMVVPHPEVNL